MIEVHPATADRWDDVSTVVGSAGICWCQYWRLSSSGYSSTDAAARKDLLREQVSGAPAPGVVGYLDGEPVGWCGFGPRTALERLVRSRTIPKVDDRPVWSIVCFIVRVGYRRRGVARALLDGAIAYARSEGAVCLEAYPVDTMGRRIDVSFAYVGTVGLFEGAGFRRVVETEARSARLPRWLMRLELDRPSAGPG